MRRQRKTIFFSVLCLNFAFILSIASGQDLPLKLAWGNSVPGSDSSQPAHYPWFSGAVFRDPGQVLPLWMKVIRSSPGAIIKAQVQNADYEPLPADESVPGLQGLVSAPEVQVVLNNATSQGQLYTEISFFPFRKNPETNQIERLTKGTLHIEESPGMKSQQLTQADHWQDHSVLESGYWFKFKVNATGIYKIPYNKLLEMGISDPATVRIYGNGGAEYPTLPGRRKKDDLIGIPVYFDKGSDGIFNQGDYILVYLEGPGSFYYDPSRGMLLHQLHKFSEAAYYFITCARGPAKDIPLVPSDAAAATHVENVYTAMQWHEKELYNPIRSGSRWLGERFYASTHQEFSFPFTGISTGSKVKVLLGVAGRNNSSTSFTIGYGSLSLGNISIGGVNTSSSTGAWADYELAALEFSPSSDKLTLSVDYNKTDKPSAEGYLDFIDLNATCDLMLSGKELSFRSLNRIGTGEVAQFNLSGAGNRTLVWDVSDINDPRQIQGALNGTTYSFRRSSDSIREYIAFNTDAEFPMPVIAGDDVGPVANQDLHGHEAIDLVIIAPPVFAPYAEKLARVHAEKDGLRTLVTTTEEIYNEFSSGAPDVAAYRDLMKMFYDRGVNPSDKPRYLLLYGDGTYDNRTKNVNNPNYILTYQSDNSLVQNASYVTDDYFGLLDDNENEFSGALDIGIGRFPVQDTSQAEEMYEKVVHYMDPSTRGDWKDLVCFIGDDQDNGTHTEQADELANDIETRYPGFIVDKIYLDAYRQQSSPSGQSYPDVNRAIYQRVHKGALIINYTGHGNENGLAHEKILQTNDIWGWTNAGKLPLFVTATCEFSRFDDVEIEGDQYTDKTSAGEWILLNGNGGGIALLTTTRLVYSGPNFYLNEKFYQYVFTRDAQGDRLRLGDVLRLTKVSSGAGINKLNFTLLGDPAVQLDYPEMVIKADSVDGQLTGPAADTLKAYKKVKISGHIEDIQGTPLDDFNGEVYPVLFDKANIVTTLNNDGEGALQYSTYNSVLFRGVATVENGHFNFSFIVPKDINYQVGTGKLAMYARSASTQANGACKDLQVGGVENDALPDTEGPLVNAFMNDSSFLDGGITSPDPVLKAWVFDPDGINLTSSGIGHDITATLDNDTRLVLNDYYQSRTDDYQRGVISYPLHGLDPGLHTLTLKVWDVNNNSGEATVRFRVTEKGELRVEGLKNYPNPMSDHTWFVFDHNAAGEDLDYTISIYNMAGGLVARFSQRMTTEGFRSDPLEWDGRNMNGDPVANGFYIYKVVLQSRDGQVAEMAGRLVILR